MEETWKKRMTRLFKELKVVKDTELIAILREENLHNVVINSDREAVSHSTIVQRKEKPEKAKKPSLIIPPT